MSAAASAPGETAAGRRLVARRLVVALAFALALLTASVARADGEVGVVIQDGDSVLPFCVPFQGDSIRADQALAATGLDLVRSGANGAAVCAINCTGCSDPSSFSSCFCQCSGNNCTYWAFFSKRYGERGFTYSSLAFTLLTLRDGDIQAWKWGRGTLQSAPVPGDVSFESVCGHAPSGGVHATPAPAATTALPSPPGSTGTMAPPPAATEGETPGGTTSPPASPGGTAGTASPTEASPPAATGVPPATALPSATVAAEGGGGGSSARDLAGFGGIAAALLLATGAALVWRRRHGA